MRNCVANLFACSVLALALPADGAGIAPKPGSGKSGAGPQIITRPSAPPVGVEDLKFRDLFKLPVGDKGLEPSKRLLALDGKRVRVIGYMVKQPMAANGSFLLSPLPVEVSDEDEPLADDLPASTIAVTTRSSSQRPVIWSRGLIQAIGVLEVGAYLDAATGRVFPARIVVDSGRSQRRGNPKHASAALEHQSNH